VAAGRSHVEPCAAPDDETLAVAAAQDARAFDALYLRYAGPVYRYCYVRLRSREAAEDATSAVFLKALGAIGRYQPGNFAGWLHRIAANTVRDHHRRARPAVPLDEYAAPRDPAPLPDDLALRCLDAERLHAALERLPEEQRAAVELQLAGWSSAQIGTALDRSPEAVRMLRYRALTRLRAILIDPPDTRPGTHGGHR
jgi:RNA polymerase sigma factor (sigma-70 family)